jgi:hypothetical protein
MRQRARLGDYARPDVVLDIEDAQAAIRDLKAQLRATGRTVPDDPNDRRVSRPPRCASKSNPDLRNRERMLQKVRDFWVRGVLEKSLYREALIALGLETRPEAVADRWSMLVRTAAHAPRDLPPGARIVEVYDELGGELLILGAPGAGKTTVIGGLFGAAGGLFGMLLGVIHGTTGLLYLAIAVLISAGCSAGSGLVFGGMVGDRLDMQAQPNQGIRRSARSALTAWLLFGLAGAAVGGMLSALISNIFRSDDNAIPADTFFWVGGVLPSALIGLLMAGLIGALAFGGCAVLSQIVLRMVLWRSGALPLNYVRFLDYAAERVFLRKVGGGYIFVHRLLLEHFASR